MGPARQWELRPFAPTAWGNEGTLPAPQQGDNRGLANSSAQWSGEVQKAGLSNRMSLPALGPSPYLAPDKQEAGALPAAAGSALGCHLAQPEMWRPDHSWRRVQPSPALPLGGLRETQKCLFGKCTQHAPPPAGRARGQPVCVSSCEASLSLCCSLLLHSHSATHLFQLHQPSPYFDLGDPYCRHLRAEYNSLHDPYLQDYHNRKDNLQNLKNRGLVTEDGKVGLDEA